MTNVVKQKVDGMRAEEASGKIKVFNDEELASAMSTR